MKYISIIALAIVMSTNIASADSIFGGGRPANSAASSFAAAPVISSDSSVLSSEGYDFESEYEGEGPGDARGMAYNNGMYGGRDFYLGDYLGFNPAWIYPGVRTWGSFNPGFDAYR